MSSVSKPRVRQNRHKQGLNQTLEKISADFRYHNTHDGKEYYGLVVYEPITDVNGKEIRAMRGETKIDSNSTNELLKLLNNRTQWKNKTLINVMETSSSQRIKRIIYE